uniref:Ribosomal protein S1 n=1 Tax=Histiona aroides TaxID=392300 RepID=M4Q9G8_HISAR|nr:ribosomal protein S1 [Histiona aroides]AGH24062.1 ribosomal protein S1 [Histiona aroides]
MMEVNDNINNNFSELFRKNGFLRPKLEGSFIEGTIVSKNKHIVSVYTGLKNNAQFVEKELQPIQKRGSAQLNVGNTVQLYTHVVENRDGESVLNPQYYGQKLKAVTAWERVSKLKYAKGIVLNTVNGGFSVGIGGVVTFLPRSRAKLPKTGKKEYIQHLVGTYNLYKVIKVNYVRKNIVVSLVNAPNLNTNVSGTTSSINKPGLSNNNK